MRNQSVLVRVPATVGNLGGAQNHAALALDASLNLKATRKADGRLNIRYFGENGERVPRDRTNLIARAFESALHYSELQFTGADFEIYSSIPVGCGFGSSAAAVWAGLVAANLLYGLGLDEQALLDLAAIFEPCIANLHAAWKGGLAVRTKAEPSFDQTRVSQEFSLLVIIPAGTPQQTQAVQGPEPEDATVSQRLASALAAYLSRPDRNKLSFWNQTPSTEVSKALSVITESLQTGRNSTLPPFVCGNGPAIGFLTHGLHADTVLNIQEDLLHRHLAHQVWNLRPANCGAQEWNDLAVTAPVPVGGKIPLASAARLSA